MTQDEIIEMARQAKAIPMHKDFNQLALIGTENLEAFAKLVAAKAIAELESQDDGYCQACDGALCTAKKGCVALSNPPQRTEPPDWFPAVENILNEYGLQAIDFVADFKAAMKDAEKSQRTWVGLTKEQLATTDWSADFRAGALWAEAKLKDKNCAG